MTWVRWIFLLLVSAGACQPAQRAEAPQTPGTARYANGFRLEREGLLTRLIISRPYQRADQVIEYWLIPEGYTERPRDPTVHVIPVPAKDIVCTSTTHIPMLDYLGLTDRLTGFPTPDYISSAKARERIDNGSVRDVGRDNSMNFEVLALLKPSVLMAYQLTGDFGQLYRVRELGIPVVVNAEYLEEHPLGRAEWIKVMGALFGKEKEADSVFTQIEANYMSALKKVKGVSVRPTVISGTLYGSTWFLPGGRNHVARLFADAGLTYLWSDTPETGSLELGFEAVLQRAREADLWLGAASFASLNAMKEADQRYSLFRAFREGQVYTYNRRMGATGGNEYLELGYLRPDIILEDLIAIAHPERAGGHTLFFFQRLE
jgi:iron complex transport system substrate-binding protein